MTGGSDCHGLNKGKPLIGTVKVPYQHVEKLKARAAEIKAAATPHAVDDPHQSRQMD